MSCYHNTDFKNALTFAQDQISLGENPRGFGLPLATELRTPHQPPTPPALWPHGCPGEEVVGDHSDREWNDTAQVHVSSVEHINGGRQGL